ncbi:arsenate reductase ArsC [Sphingomonas sp.]|jgi:arsenate reductase (thioredoxin)|uniref:arsenate reductase ArsC n=1 Tax=Sphingomonas sp. TaxID=28214 RepID=UPI0035A99C4F
MMTQKIVTVLFLCTGNSARSILAEALLNDRGAGRFRAFSAGSQPKGVPHPMALALLAESGLATAGLRSKSWDEFAGTDAPVIDIVITVCDNAAGEMCPVWPGHPVTAHWGIEDPAAVDGEGQRDAFEAARRYLLDRIEALIALPPGAYDPATLKAALAAIGAREGATAHRNEVA